MRVAFAAAEPGIAAHVFVDSLGDHIAIEGSDRHHLQRVRRLGVREKLTAADNTGMWRCYEIDNSTESALTAYAIDAPVTEPSPQPAVTSAVSLFARAKFEALAAQLAELGIVSLVPVYADRSVVRWDTAKALAACERLRAIAREAAMQCRRARIMAIENPRTLDAFVGTAGLLAAELSGQGAADLLTSGHFAARRICTVLSGPEGGFSAREYELLRDVPRLWLGRHVLRAETAPVAAAAVLAQFDAPTRG